MARRAAGAEGVRMATDQYPLEVYRIVWRFLLGDWKGVIDQLTASA
jgi:hypothetical protein